MNSTRWILSTGTLLLALFLALPAPACLAQETETTDAPADAAPAETTIVAALEGAESFTILVQALRDTGLDQVLAADGPFTLFAPTDEAFEALPEGTLASLTKQELADILRYHVVSALVLADEVAQTGELASVHGSVLTFTEGTMVNDATILEADLIASNGVIHVIDTVLMPPAGDL